MELKKKKDLQVGVKYRGYGVVNEYGEFEFIPENTGARKGKKKLISQGLGYSVYATREKLIVHIACTLPDPENRRLKLMNSFMNKVNETLKIIRDYEI